jgi:hypothetical protein
VRLRHLHDFFYNSDFTLGLDEPITGLVQSITVIITTSLRRWTDEECQSVQKQLRVLSECANAQRITIEITGDGDLAGTDLPTQEAIRTIAPIVKALIDQFQDLFTISKVLSLDNTSQNITAYWSAPTTKAKSRYRKSKASFEEIMNVQLEYWSKSQEEQIVSNR